MITKLKTKSIPFFRYLLGRLSIGKLSKHQLLAALAKQVGYKKLEQVLMQIDDQRELIHQAATFINMSESDLIKNVSNYLKLPIAQRVKAIAPEIARQYDLEQLLQAAVIPLIADDMLIGYAAANPVLAIERCTGITDQQLFLAAWSEIRTALLASQESFKAWEAAQIVQLKEHASQQIQRVLLSVLQQAGKYNCSELLLRILNQEICYEFRVNDGRRGKGQINLGLKSALIEQMNQYVQTKQTVVAEDAFSYTLNINVLSPNEAYQLNIVTVEETPKTKSLDYKPETQTEPTVPAQEKVQNFANTVNISTKQDQPIQLLVIEDNPAFSKVLQCFLGKQGFQVNFAMNGKDALQQLTEGHTPDVIICDVHMPEMNGHELVRNLRLSSATRDIPIIMLTSDHDTETELQFIDYGVDAFISKSSDPRLLVGYAKRLASRYRAQSVKQEAA